VVDFAIFYHDAVYNVLRKDNEQRSAAMAAQRLALLGFPPQKIEQTVIFIEATQTHQVPMGLKAATDLEFFLDFDMSVLAAERDIYGLYRENVRKEYRLIPAPLYRPGRKKFLQTCLQSESIFHTTEFRSRYEAQARDNIKWELETDYGE
jgi:predicted metal-dependent HD superfamily phosphohydrolase